MTRTLRALPTLLRVAANELTAYRAEVLIWILTATMPLVMLAIWDSVTEAGPVGGLTQADMARYFTVTLVVRQLTSCWVVWELNQLIRAGGLSPQLLRPLHPMWFQAARHVVALPLRLGVLAPVVAMLVLWRPEMALPLDFAHLSTALLSCFLGFCVVFAFQWTFGCLAFWSGQSLGVFNVWFGLWTLFGGYLMPLSVMPETLRTIAEYLPFRAMLSLPVEIASGVLPPERWLGALTLQLGWVVASGLLAARIWRAGLLRYGAFGA